MDGDQGLFIELVASGHKLMNGPEPPAGIMRKCDDHAIDQRGPSSSEVEWQTYLDELLSQHGRKYKLVPMLKALGR